MSEAHKGFLRSIVRFYAFNAETKRAILEAADYIDELEGQVKMLNKLGNLEPADSHMSDRLAALEDRINRAVTQMDLDNQTVQLRSEFARFTRINK